MSKDQKFGITKNFAKRFLRGIVKSVPLLGKELLDEIIFGTLDDEAAQAESKKLHARFDEILKQHGDREVDLVEILAGVHSQADFNEQVLEKFAEMERLLREPDKYEVPDYFSAAIEKVFSQNEDLAEAVSNGIGDLSDGQEQIAKMIRGFNNDNRTESGWDEFLCEEGLIDIDEAKVWAFKEIAEKRGFDVPETTRLKVFMEEFGLYYNEKLTRGAVLLFGKNPQRGFKQSSVRCIRFKGNHPGEVIDDLPIGETLLVQQAECEKFIKRNIRKGWCINDFDKEEQWEYPLDAVREGIRNAIVHRDYSSNGRVRVRIFDNRIEIRSPGGLPDNLTVKLLLDDDESKPRNKLLADVYYKAGLIEHLGLGIYNMIKACKEYGLPQPEFKDNGETFRVTFFGPEEDFKTERVKIEISGLPVTDSELFGRNEELALLDKAWNDEKFKVFVFVAWGGVGKSALVNEWLERMSDDGWRGATRVYGWSFYSQGTKEQGGATSDGFFLDTLKWFGDEEMALSKKSGREKALRLAELIRQEQTLLVLDGLEPLQYPPGPMGGRLKDEAVAVLLRNLAKSNNGLCVVTTREEVKDIEGSVGRGVKRVDLENLSKEAGAEVLRGKGVVGTDKELKDTSEEFVGHALALNLLGNYLAVVHKGEVRKKDLVPKLTDEKEKGGHAKRVMESYEVWLRGSDEPALDVLYLMGLFDRPAVMGAVDVLRSGEVIEGLNDKLAGLDEAEWKYALGHLRELGLLAKEEGEGDRCRAVLDCHPLVREHFGEKLKMGMADAWRAGHERLYEYYKGLPEKHQPDTLEEMEPLFRAVYHGCEAGKVQETLYDVYWKRVKRSNEHYSTKKLGAFGSDLGAVACFFDKLWSKPAEGLSEQEKAGILNWAGYGLRAVGRLNEAAEPMVAGMKLQIGQEDWENVARAAGNVSELYLTLGQVGKAAEFAEKAVEYADRSGNEFERMAMRTTYGDALCQAGDIERAKELLCEIERMQAERQPEYPLLYSARGYLYCDLLLGEGEYENALERGRYMLDISERFLGKGLGLLDIALGRLSIGRALMGLAIRDGGGWDEASEWLDRAVDGLRESGNQDEIPRGLLCRGAMYRERGMYDEAMRDLEEVYEIAERGGMKLFMVDYDLEAGRVCRAMGDGEGARRHYDAARLGIEETGYHRRDGEVF